MNDRFSATSQDMFLICSFCNHTAYHAAPTKSILMAANSTCHMPLL